MKRLSCVLLVTSLLVLNLACKKSVEQEIGVIWSDNVEFAWYCELFNASQGDHRFVVEYKKNIVDDLLSSEEVPDIIVSSFVNVSATRASFRKMDRLLTKMDASLFYEELLELGKVDSSQYLLPVSFNLPCLIFSIKNTHLLQNSFTISLDDLKQISPRFNSKSRGLYTKMGFAPRWEGEAMYLAMQGMDVNFEEKILAVQNENDTSQDGELREYIFKWDEAKLQDAINYLKKWTGEVNGSAEEEEDFKFKYLYNAPYILIENNFCAFYYMPTNRLFSTAQEKMKNLDFRYMEVNGKIPCKDDVLYMAITKESKNVKGTEAFVKWFYSPKTQEVLLNKKMTTSFLREEFGIAGGFSAIRQVTDEIFPKYYPLLLSHLLPYDSLKVPSILPNNWNELKEKILMPYLEEATRVKAEGKTSYELKSLDQRVTEWVQKHMIKD